MEDNFKYSVSEFKCHELEENKNYNIYGTCRRQITKMVSWTAVAPKTESSYKLG